MKTRTLFFNVSPHKAIVTNGLRDLILGTKTDIFSQKPRYGVLKTSILRSKSPQMLIA